MGGGQEPQVTAVTADTTDPPAPRHHEIKTSPPTLPDATTNKAKGSDEAHDYAYQDRIPTPRAGLGNIIDRYGGVDSGWGTLILLMVPEPSSREYRTASWAASFVVRCEDVARLMREGFFWGPDDVVPEEGFLCRTVNPAWLGCGFRYGRVWILADKSHGQKPAWVGHLEVATTRSLEALANFELQNLTNEHISIAHAKNAGYRSVYGYNRRWPGDCYNCIYDRMPLPGWWPWPKEGAGSAVADPNMGMAAWEDELLWSPPSIIPGASSADAADVCDDGDVSGRHQHQATSCVIM